jgi:four helix bundle protein
MVDTRHSSLVTRQSGRPRGYRDLDVYQPALDALVDIHRVVLAFPDFEKYDLASQLRRASKSIPANIAEGYAKRRSSKELAVYLTTAMASANEADVHIEVARRLGYISDEEFERLSDEYDHIGRQLAALIRATRVSQLERRGTSDERRPATTNEHLQEG